MSGKVPPSSKAGTRRPARTAIEKVANKYRRFTGHEVDLAEKVQIPPLPKVVTAIGPCDGIMYSCIRDGKFQSFIHKFAQKDAPLMCITETGKLFLVGGNYRFTERGLMDRSYQGD